MQPTISLSSTEAEFLAASDAGKMALYLRSILDELHVPQTFAKPSMKILVVPCLRTMLVNPLSNLVILIYDIMLSLTGSSAIWLLLKMLHLVSMPQMPSRNKLVEFFLPGILTTSLGVSPHRMSHLSHLLLPSNLPFERGGVSVWFTAEPSVLPTYSRIIYHVVIILHFIF